LTGTDDFVFGHYEAKGRRTPVCLPIIFCVDAPGGADSAAGAERAQYPEIKRLL